MRRSTKQRPIPGRNARLVGALIIVWTAAVACAVIPKGTSPGASGGAPAPGASSGKSSNPSTVVPDLVIVNSMLGEQQAQAAGTGIVLTPTGEVITNNHVIAGATSVQATDAGNGRTYTATVVGYDRSHDVAVLRLQGANGLATAPLNTGVLPVVGARIAAIGDAGGTGSLSVVTGKISALNESVAATDQSSGSVQQLSGLIQVNANVQPGDSGGPLVDAASRVIGITTAAGTGFSFRGGATGTEGFAIPIGDALTVRSLIDAGRTTGTVHIGATAQLGVVVGGSARGGGGGVMVVSVLPGQAAASAGIVPGDTITSLGGASADSPTTLASLVDRYHPGQSTAVRWTDRFGQRHTANVTLGQGPAG